MEKKEGHILLEPIIPENMPETMNLLTNVLGLIGKEVEAICKESEKNKSNCCVYKKHDLEIEYERLLKYYAYMQKDYKEISKEQYTTDQNHIYNSAKQYMAHQNFIQTFYSFIEELLQKKQTEKDESNLLFFFLDDVDLSTTRCADIIKTLLSYINHPKIVTILSGDLATFEEALTLELLRQEDLGDTIGYEKNYIDSELNRPLEQLRIRKNELAKEYLKKILPPRYRHHIAYRNLEQKANFLVMPLNQNNGGIELIKLFKEVSQRENSLFENYFSVNDGEKDKNILLPFLLFDNVARGLNNVGHILLQYRRFQKEPYQKKKEEEWKSKNFLYQKTLLETMLYSNPILNENRATLLYDIISFGKSKEDTTISFENLYSIFAIKNEEKVFEINLNSDNFPQIIQEVESEIGRKIEKKRSVEMNDRMLSDKLINDILNKNEILKNGLNIDFARDNIEKNRNIQAFEKKAQTYFTIFIYCDYMCRLLQKDNILKMESYVRAKEEALAYLLIYPGMNDTQYTYNDTFNQIYQRIKKSTNFRKKNLLIEIFLHLDFNYAMGMYNICNMIEYVESISITRDKLNFEMENIKEICWLSQYYTYAENNLRENCLDKYFFQYDINIERYKELLFHECGKEIIKQVFIQFWKNKEKEYGQFIFYKMNDDIDLYIIANYIDELQLTEQEKYYINNLLESSEQDSYVESNQGLIRKKTYKTYEALKCVLEGEFIKKEIVNKYRMDLFIKKYIQQHLEKINVYKDSIKMLLIEDLDSINQKNQIEIICKFEEENRWWDFESNYIMIPYIYKIINTFINNIYVEKNFDNIEKIYVCHGMGLRRDIEEFIKDSSNQIYFYDKGINEIEKVIEMILKKEEDNLKNDKLSIPASIILKDIILKLYKLREEHIDSWNNTISILDDKDIVEQLNFYYGKKVYDIEFEGSDSFKLLQFYFFVLCKIETKGVPTQEEIENVNKLSEYIRNNIKQDSVKQHDKYVLDGVTYEEFVKTFSVENKNDIQ